eukprot:COSAG02_NODE_1163_length_14166_cov_62.952797_11_plen_100_part_00
MAYRPGVEVRRVASNVSEPGGVARSNETMPPLDVTVAKGPGGFGMNISEHGVVTSFSGDDCAAKLAGVPIKSRIVRFAKLYQPPTTIVRRGNWSRLSRL